MMNIQCYYCDEKFDTLTEIVTHCKIVHFNQKLQFRELILDEKSGKYGYKTKLYDIVPELLGQNKEVTVENGMVVVKRNFTVAAIKTPIKLKPDNNQINPITDLSRKPKYMCVYCNIPKEILCDIIHHCTEHHADEVLKYREYVFDSVSNKHGYRSKLHEGIVPSTIKGLGKHIAVQDNIVLISDSSKRSQIVNTPVKPVNRKENEDEHAYLTDLNEEDSYQNDHEITTDDAITEMENLLPKVLNTMFESGKLESYLKFNRIIANGKLPMNNICFLLFSDLVEWFSCQNTSNMRYRTETIKFWQIGYRLFHGKFLRFMSGLRNYGQVLDQKANTSELDPADSQINFAVPAQKNLYRTEDKIRPLYPGIFEEHIEVLAERFAGIPLKLCVDGKKISRGKGKTMGDIDCWGHESQPTLKEKKSAHLKHLNNLQVIQSNLDCFVDKGTITLGELESANRIEVLRKFQKEIQCLAENNKLLREKYVSLEQMENKFKTLGGKDWMTSRFYPVICSVRVNRSAINTQLEESLRLTNQLAQFAASLNGKLEHFSEKDTVSMKGQANNFSLNESYVTEESRYIKQRTDKWFNIRNDALVTGSTCNSALGLAKLKDQQAHYDVVVLRKQRPEFSDEIKEKMKYGTDHEKDAIATVCSKVIPALYPDLCMYEEGCMRIEYDRFDSFMVVSPDGSLRDENQKTALAYETKCKSPTSYSKSAYYTIPLYYMPQLLCEMKACDSDRLLFTCWSEQSMTVFEVENDKPLWEKCWTELTTIYASDTRSRPKHFTEQSKSLKKDMKIFRDKKTKLIGEFPSATVMKEMEITNSNATDPYITRSISVSKGTSVKLEGVQQTVATLKTWHVHTYDQLRSISSEILVFMLTDLNRIYDMESNNAHVIGYAMKGPSLKNETFRLMMKEVITVCEKYGLNVTVTSADGQWHQYGVRDDNQKPLTVHQLQRDIWMSLRSFDKGKLQSMIRKLCLVQTADDVCFEKEFGRVNVIGHRRDKAIRIQPVAMSEDIIGNKDKDSVTGNDDYTNTLADVPGCITGEFEEVVGPETIDEIDRVTGYGKSVDSVDFHLTGENLYSSYEPVLFDLDMESVSMESSIENGSFTVSNEVTYEQQARLFENDIVDNHKEHMELQETSTLFGMAHQALYGGNYWGINTTDMEIDQSTCVAPEFDFNLLTDNEQFQVSLESPMRMEDVHEHDKRSITDVENDDVHIQHSVMKSLNADMFNKMLHDLQHDEKSMQIHKWLEVSIDEFIEFCSSKDKMNKHLQKREVFVCAKCIERECKELEIRVLSSIPKYQMLRMLYDEHPKRVDPHTVPKRKKQKLTTLKDLCWSALKYMVKEQLMIILAEHKWEVEYNAWKEKSPIPFGIQIVNVCNEMQWFTQPREEEGLVRFHFTDACHILTCLRTKLCTTGIEGLKRKAWEIAALSKQTNLNVTVIVDCVDKQDVGLARRVFAEDVENVISQNGYSQEATFCRLIRRWFDSEDEPAISANERCVRRLELLKWLLDGYQIGKFPSPTRYVKGIPIVTFEALVAHLERKIQLYPFVTGSYNVRATGTQEVEQLFSSFRDMDPSGTGTVKPESIPGMLASAIEVDNYRLNPNKSFYMRTSRAEVYPSHSSLASDLESEQTESFYRLANEGRQITCIIPRDHTFDDNSRDHRKHKRPSARVSLPNEPAHGELGVRQYHRRDDSKIPAHRRLGFMELPNA